jgi:3-oxoadipate enol-lactonase
MPIAALGGIDLHYCDDGPRDGRVMVFSNSLGTDLRLWDPLLPYLPANARVIRYDRRGHGLSDVPPAPYSMGQLVRDTELLLDYLGVRDCTFVGLSIGGMVAQGLAVKRPDLIGAMVLSNTAARIATAEIWRDRMEKAARDGLNTLTDSTMERWFSAPFRAGPELPLWRNMFQATPLQGWIGCAGAIAGTDFYTTTAALHLPTLGIAGDRDGSTPPDLVRETVDLIHGSRFVLLRGAGHLPHVEQPLPYVAALRGFLEPLGRWD